MSSVKHLETPLTAIFQGKCSELPARVAPQSPGSAGLRVSLSRTLSSPFNRRESVPRGKPITILMADDDADDRMLTGDAFTENRLLNDLRFVEDGEELMDYLYHRGKYAKDSDSPRPGLILLDLNMPRKDGREALGQIKTDENPRQITNTCAHMKGMR